MSAEETENMKQNEFKTYHPTVNFTYFLLVISLSMTFMHPLCLLLSMIGSFLYSAYLAGGKKLLYSIPLFLLTALINPAFNHAGVTVLAYFPSGNPLTLESVLYGLASGAMIANVIAWFSCCNAVMTSDKFIYLFGAAAPSLSLVLSMAFRFIPRFITQTHACAAVQAGIGRDTSRGGVLKRAKNGISIISIIVTWSLENAIEISDSMKARGYGLTGRTSFSIFKFEKRDKKSLFIISALGVYVLAGKILGFFSFRYIPSLKAAPPSLLGFSFFAAYFLLCIFPLAAEIWEAKRWKHIN